MSPRRIRLPYVPADFRVPPGWPVPTDRWLRENLFWVPEPDWTPQAGLRSAPDGWAFWQPNKEWNRRGLGDSDLTRALLIGVAGTWAVTLSSRIAAGFLGSDSAPLLALTVFALVVGIALLLTRELIRSHRSRALLEELAVTAGAERRQRLAREYQRYLTDAA